MQQQKSNSPENEIADEIFYREIEERAKQADRERREVAQRARDNYRRNSMQLNVCFDTDNHATILLQAPPLHSPNKSNEKNIRIELVDKKSSVSPSFVINDSKKIPIEREQSPLTIIEREQS